MVGVGFLERASWGDRRDDRTAYDLMTKSGMSWTESGSRSETRMLDRYPYARYNREGRNGFRETDEMMGK